MKNKALAHILQYIMSTYYMGLRGIPRQIAHAIKTDYPSPKELLEKMSDKEKLTLIAGVNGFCIPPIDSLKLPPVWMSDATSGVRGVDADVTTFPSPIAMAATFNTELVKKGAQVIGAECRALGISILLAPGVNIARVPINGRNFEYFGEDPFLAKMMALHYVKGAQSKGVGVSVKHFACNNSEYDRHKSNSIVDERTLREIYLPAFKACVEGGAVGVMTSYNQINGEYGSEHSYLLSQVLRKEWKYTYMVISDWNSLYSTDRALLHGVDIEMPKRKHFPPIDAHLTQEQRNSVNEKVLHILNTLDVIGAYKRDLIDKRRKIKTKAHEEVALEIAKESVVLLKNEDVLPLVSRKMKKIAIIGRFATKEPIGGGGSSFIKQSYPGLSLDTLLKKSYPNCEVHSFGRRWYKNWDSSQFVSSCDAVIVNIGFNHVDESESYDRRWRLNNRDIEDITHASKMNSNTIAIVHSGGAVEMPSWYHLPSAIVYSWYLGSYSAKAIKGLLFGEFSPSGRLPFTIGGKLEDYASMKGYPKNFDKISFRRVMVGQGKAKVRSILDINYSEKLMVGYRQFDTIGPDPLYPFGFGLSYSTFEYNNLEVKREGSNFHISIELTNTGGKEASEVVQLYLRPKVSNPDRPFQQLKGFNKVLLKVKEKREVSFVLGEEDFSYYDTNLSSWVVDKEPYTICIGSSSREIKLTSDELSM